ncbi:MAG: hypothetical protein H0U44_03520 [Flavisolibacter sp.]|jgi:hypothetical protein|nr:hypothetical protein [Flavisolibacter sp.]
MESKSFFKAGVLALFLVAAFVISWELFWRSKGAPVSFNDDEALWAKSRAEIYLPSDKSTVFIGSSRIKFDLDIPTWEKLTGEKAIQLSMVGTNPVPLLEDLADDPEFKGKLIVDVTEPLFFSLGPQASSSALEGIEYFKNQTPSQKFSSKINHALEANFVFLEEGKYSVTALLEDLELENRKDVFRFPPFPKGFEVTNYNRQTFMTQDFMNDSIQVQRQTAIWMGLGKLFKTPPIKGDTLQQYFTRIKKATDKIKERGGKVVFVRTPASGPMEAGTKAGFPRNVYWDQLLSFTSTQGVHYEDDPGTASFICPEMSHLSPADAIVYTQHLVKTLSAGQGGSFFTPKFK